MAHRLPDTAEEGRVMEARYLRVKKWAEFQHYDPTKRRPPWIKFYNTLLDSGDPFMELSEAEQWQLVRIWLVASRSEALTLDESGVVVPAVVDDEHSLRRSTMSLRPLPLAKFIRLGWLIPVAASELLGASAPAITVASTGDSPPLKEQRFREKLSPRAVTSEVDAQPLDHQKVIELSLKGAA